MNVPRRAYLAIAAIVVVAAVGVAVWWPNSYARLEKVGPKAPLGAELLLAGPLGDLVLGAADAPVTMIEYAAVTCSHCANFYVNVFPVLKSRYIDTGKVRYILREFSLNQLDDAGFMLARCAGDDKYLAMIDVLFRRQSEWVVERPLEPLLAIAKQAGISKERFDACLSDQRVLDGIHWVGERAEKQFGVDATPTFFVNGRIERGELTVDEMEALLKPYLTQ